MVLSEVRSQELGLCKHVQCQTPRVIRVEVLSYCEGRGKGGRRGWRGIWEPTECRWYLQPGDHRGSLRREGSH